MRKFNLILPFLLFSIQLLFAQDRFPQLWKTEFAFKPEIYNFRNPQGTLFLGVGEKDVQMLDENGKEIWRTKSEKYGLKEIELVTWVKAAGVIRLGTKKTKKQPAISVFIDAKTGNELWRSEKITWMGLDRATIDESYIPEMNAIYVQYDFTMVLIELKTGKEIWTVNTYANLGIKSLECFRPDGMDIYEVVVDEAIRTYYDIKTGELISAITSKYFNKQQSSLGSLLVSDEDMHLRLDYKRKLMRGSTGTNTPMVLSAKKFSTGEPLWETKFDANLVTTLATQRDMLKFYVSGGKVFVVYEGISVFDLKTGKILWKSDFNNSEVSVGLKAKQELAIADVPLVDGNDAYIADLTSKVQGIRKVNAATGETIWKTEKYSSSDVIPALHLKNGVLLAQFGGVINIQTYFESDQITKRTSKWKFRGNPDIKAYNPASGQLLWDAKKLGIKMDFISSFLFQENMVYFFTDANFYGVEISSGSIKTKIDLKDAKLGEPLNAFFSADNQVVALMEKGFCSLDLKSAAIQYASKVKDVTGYFVKGRKYFLKTGDEQEDFVGIDISSGKVSGKFSGDESDLTEDGRFVIEMKKEKVAKYKAD